MKRMLTVVLKVSADSILRRRVMTAAMIVGITVLIGCSSDRCHRCRSRTTPNCQKSVCQHVQTIESPCVPAEPINEATTDSPNVVAEIDDEDLITKPVSREGLVVEADQGSNQSSTQSSDTETMYGHGENYEWLMGVLQRVHVPRKGWKVRYAPLDQQDRWGGSVVPAADVRMDEFEEGDNVFVEGEVIRDRASLYLAGPRYRITTIRRVNEGDAHRVFIDR
jgi:hypothetical protein